MIVRTLLVIGFLLVLSACSSDDDSSSSVENKLIGSWKLIEQFGSAGGQPTWQPVEDGYTYTFEASGRLISDRFSCNGMYTRPSQENTNIRFECDDILVLSGSYFYYFEESDLILEPVEPCDEGCLDKFRKID